MAMQSTKKKSMSIFDVVSTMVQRERQQIRSEQTFIKELRSCQCDDLAEELSRLRTLHMECRARVSRWQWRYDRAVIDEKEEKQNYGVEKVLIEQKVNLTLRVNATKIQRRYRRYRIRKRLFELQLGVLEVAKHMLPERHQAALLEMRQAVYQLRYTSEDFYNAAVLVQSWWRICLIRRFAVVLRTVKWVHAVWGRMQQTAVLVQKNFRFLTTHRGFAEQLRLRQERLQYEQLIDMTEAHCALIKVQRALRAKLGRRRLEQLYQEDDIPIGAFDSTKWTPTSTRKHRLQAQGIKLMQADPGSPLGQVVLLQRLRKDAKLIIAELEPFRNAISSSFMRHRVGGDTAVAMRWALNDELLEGHNGAPRKLHDAYLIGRSVACTLVEDERETCESDDGLAHGDVWSVHDRIGQRRQRLRGAGPKSARNWGNVPPLPVHAERRALERNAIRQRRSATEALGQDTLPPCAEATIIHPLLVNAPPPPPLTDDGELLARQVAMSPGATVFTPQAPSAPRSCGFPSPPQRPRPVAVARIAAARS